MLPKRRHTRGHFEALEQRRLLAADVAVELRHLPDAFFPGRHQTYELRVSNRGDEDALGVHLVHETDLADLHWKVIREDQKPHGYEIHGLVSGGAPAQAIGIGDFNRDGIEDFAVGDAAANNTGAVYVVFGGEDFNGVDLRELNGENGFVLHGPRVLGPLESIGSSLAVADVNGDGIDDLLIGSQQGDSRVVFGGREYGSSVEAAGEAGFKVRSAAGPYGRRLVSSAGDFNHDGIEDFAVTERNSIYVIYGGSDIGGDISLAQLEESKGISFNSDTEVTSAFVSDVGDVNGDNIGDIAFANHGNTYILFGGREWPNSRNVLGSAKFEHGAVISTHGEIYRPTRGGDFNGDGIQDVVLVGSQATYVVFGGQGLSQASIGLSDTFSETKQVLRHDSLFQFQASVIARDVDLDGLTDLVVGHSRREGAVVDVVFGSEDSNADLRVFRVFTDTDNTRMQVGGLGDLDQDGVAELWLQSLGRLPQAQIVNLPKLRVDRSDLSGSDDLDVSIDIPAGNEIVFRVGADTPIGYGGEIVSTAEAILSGNDANPADNAIEHRATIRALHDLDLQVAPPSVQEVRAGEEVRYSFSVTNDGTAARNVTVHDAATAVLENVTWRRREEAFSPDHFLSNVVDPDPGSFYFRDWLKDGTTLDGDNGFVLEGRRPLSVHSDDTVLRQYPIGRSVSARGDVNGDGLDDIVVGQQAEVFVKFGSAGEALGRIRPEELTRADGLLIAGFENDFWATQVEVVGDVNSDGLDDILIGVAPRNSGFHEFYVVFGRETFGRREIRVDQLSGEDGFRISRLARATSVRNANYIKLAGGGDLNGDGVDDLAMATTAEVAVLFGGAGLGSGGEIKANELNGTDGFRIGGREAPISGVRDVAAGGDLNADGVDDLAIVLNDDLFVIFGQLDSWPGQLDPLSSKPGRTLRITGVRPASVDMGGDVNGDGVDDLLVGSAIDPNLGIYNDPGSAHVLLGASDLVDLEVLDLSADYGLKVVGGGSHSAGLLGDVNGDGIDDLAVGDRWDVHVVFGSSQHQAQHTIDADMLDVTQGFTWKLGRRLPQGIAIGGPSDVNGDGVDDLVINFDAWHWVYRSATDRYADGETHVIFGRRAETTSGAGDIHEVIVLPEAHTITYTVSGTVPSDHEGELQVGATARLPVDLSVSALETPVAAMQEQPVEFKFEVRNESDIEAIDVAVQGNLFEGMADVTWRAEKGFSPVSEIYELDSSQVQLVDEVTATALMAAAPKLPWDYNGDGVQDNMAHSNLTRLFGRGDLVFNEHTFAASLGDIDADGFDDLVHVGSTFLLGETGPVTVHFGTGKPLSRADVIELDFGQLRFLLNAAPIGDFNGDGIHDLALSDAAFEGSVYIVFGGPDIRSRLASPLTVDGLNGFQIVGTIPRELFSDIPFRSGDGVGARLDGIGDINQDGLDDLLITASGPWPNPNDYFVVYGEKTTTHGKGPINDVLDIPPRAAVTYTVFAQVAEIADAIATGIEARQGLRQADLNVSNNTATQSMLVNVLGDFNRDAVVNLADFQILALNFGKTQSATAFEGDLSGDGEVSFRDFLLFSIQFGTQ